MEIKREKNFSNVYDYTFSKDNSNLKISYGGNYDLYLALSDGEIVPEDENVVKTFNITKEDGQLYNAFDELYQNIINGNPFGEGNDSSGYNYRDRYEYQRLVDENGNIVWVSDDGPEDRVDRLVFSKEDDAYKLSFYRVDKELDSGFKNPLGISVRICNSGSRYDPFNCAFMLMYEKIQEIDTKENEISTEKQDNLKLEKKARLG